MVESSDFQNSQPLEPIRRDGVPPADHDQGKNFQTSALAEIRGHKPGEQLAMLRKMLGVKDLPLATDDKQSPLDREKRNPNHKGDPIGEPTSPKHNELIRLGQQKDKSNNNPFVAPISEALIGPKRGPDVLPEGTTTKDLARAKEILKEAGIKNPSPERINAVLAAQAILRQPGVGTRAIKNKQGNFEDISGRPESETKYMLKYGGEDSDEFAHALSLVASEFQLLGDNKLAIYYFKQGISKTKEVYGVDEDDKTLKTGHTLLASQHRGLAASALLVRDYKSADEHFASAIDLYERIYKAQDVVTFDLAVEMYEMYRDAADPKRVQDDQSAILELFDRECHYLDRAEKLRQYANPK